MLQNFVILSMCLVVVRATGEFSVLSGPKSLSFKGDEALQSHYLGDAILAALGYPVGGDVPWSALTINDPFNLAKGVIGVYVDGVSHISVGSQAKIYELQGGSIDESLNDLSAELEASNMPVCDINFSRFDEAVDHYHACFGDQTPPAAKDSKLIDPSQNAADKELLQAVSFISAAADNLHTMKKSSNCVLFRVSLAGIAKVHGAKSAAMAEATKRLSAAIAKLNTAAQKSSNNEALVVVVTDKYTGSRTKREVITGNIKNPYNLAEYYDQDYPVIFNIILWFMVAFGFSLLAICYAIGSMDPGRDSIIYRMTSNRMKKDN